MHAPRFPIKVWHRTLSRAWLILALCWPAAQALALDPDKAIHQYVVDQWSIEAGLPQVSVLAIAQDRTGYMWFATQLGAARFDGVRFTGFNPRNTPGFPGEQVQALAADPEGGMWIGTYKGLGLWSAGEFRAYPPLSGREVDVLDLLVDGQLGVLAATSRGLMAVHHDGLDQRFGIDAPVFALARTGEGLWAGTVGGVFRVDADGAVVLEMLSAAGQTDGLRVVRLVADGERLWAATNLGLQVREHGRWRRITEPSALAGSPVSMLYRDRDGNLWVGALAGLARVHDGRVVEFTPRGGPGTVPDYRAGYEDREGNLWLGSRANGALRLWNGWTQRYSRTEGLSEPLVWSLARAGGGRLWVGTDAGVDLLEQGRMRRVVDGAALPHPNAYTLLAEPDQLWIGTRRGLALYRPGLGLQALPARFHAVAATQINGLLRDPGGRLWIATSAGVFNEAASGLLEQDELDGATARSLLLDRETRLWVGSSKGLWRRDGLQFVSVASVEPGLPSDVDVLALLQLDNGDLLASTLSGQLLLRREQGWTVLDAASGLPANAAFFLAEDPQGWIWAGGMGGITRVRTGDLYAYADGSKAGVEGEFLLNERGARHSGQKGYCCNGAGNAKGFREGSVLWLPSRDGVVSIDMRSIRKNPVAPGLAVERYRFADAWLRVPALGQTVELPTGRRDLSIDFTALSFQDPLSISLRYWLIGYDQDWILLEDPAQRSVRYTNLPPGDYRFEIQAANNAGVWSEDVARFEFNVPAYLHETLGFRIAMGLLAVVVFIGLLRWRTRAGERQRLRLQELVEQRTQALEALNRQLRTASATDPLTGLANRRAFQEQIAGLLQGSNPASRQGTQVLLLALVDIDHFKQINDRYGHGDGDHVLVEFSALLRSLSTPAPSLLARWGGEEFLLAFHLLERTQVLSLAQSLCRQVAAHSFELTDGSALKLSASLGFVEVPLRGGEPVIWERWLELADYALYDAKESGRARWSGFRLSRDTELSRVQASPRPDIHQLLADAQLIFVRA